MNATKKKRPRSPDFRVEYKVGEVVFTPLTKRAREYMDKRRWLGVVVKDGAVTVDHRFAAPAVDSLKTEDMEVQEIRKRRAGDC